MAAPIAAILIFAWVAGTPPTANVGQSVVISAAGIDVVTGGVHYEAAARFPSMDACEEARRSKEEAHADDAVIESICAEVGSIAIRGSVHRPELNVIERKP